MRLRYIILLLFSTVSVVGAAHVYTNGDFRIEEYTLDNGLTVYLVPNSSDVDVCGTVVVRAGTVDEPDSHRGVASFLKYALNGGTQKIGSIDWQREKPVYEEIIGLYDSLSVENDRQKYLDLWQRISEKTAEAARFSSSNEFSNLLGELGATDIQDYVDTDYSRFGSNFPPSAMEQWLRLNSERFIDPVFRNFQSQLNIFYEEFNRYSIPWNMRALFAYNLIYAGTPYARTEPGISEKLIHPSMSAMTEFFDTWYVANNMALVLAGNFDTEEVKPLIEQTFGRLPNRQLPERTLYPSPDYTSKYSVKTGKHRWFSGIEWFFSGPDVDSDEFVCLDIVKHMLANSYRSGLINELEYSGLYENTNESKLNSVNNTFCRDVSGSVFYISVVPEVDGPEGRLQTIAPAFHNVKSKVFEKINMLKDENNIPEQLFLISKNYLLDEVERFLGSTNTDKAIAVCQNYVLGISMTRLFDTGPIEKTSKSDIAAFTQKYLADNYLTVIYDDNDSHKKYFDGEAFTKRYDILPELRLDIIEKPVTAVPDFNDNVLSEYAKRLVSDGMPFPDLERPACSDVVERLVAEDATMFYTPNSANPSGKNFTLTLRYEYGQQDDRDMYDMAYVLTRTGIEPGIRESSRRRMFAELGASIKMYADYNYFHIDLSGREENLERILNLTTVWMLAPWLDRKQAHDVWWNRWARRIYNNYQHDKYYALLQYVCHGKKSDYLYLSPKEDLFSVRYSPIGQVGQVYHRDYLSDWKPLDGVTKRVMSSPVDMFYRGNMPPDSVAKLLSSAPMAEMGRIQMPRQEKPMVAYRKPYVFINTEVPSQVSKIGFYAKLHSFRYDDYIPARVFSIYFRSLLDDELRLKRAMALNPAGCVAVPVQPGGECCFSGEMEVDGKNTTQAIELYMNLLKNMPIDEHRFRIAVRTCYSECVRQMYGYDKGKFYNWLKNIFPEGLPVEAWLEELKNMSVYDLQRFYEANIRQLPVQTMVAGDKQHVNAKELRKFGDVKMVGSKSLFRD